MEGKILAASQGGNVKGSNSIFQACKGQGSSWTHARFLLSGALWVHAHHQVSSRVMGACRRGRGANPWCEGPKEHSTKKRNAELPDRVSWK